MGKYRLAICTLFFCGTAHAAPLYNITALDLVPGTMDSWAFGLNEIGQPVGDSRFDRSGHIGQSRPVIWNASGVPTELWDDPFIGGSAADINNNGVVVGRYGSGSGIPLPGPGVPFGRGFVWDAAHGRRDLGLEPIGNTQAVAVNDSGQVVGTSEVLMDFGGTNLFAPRAFVWDETNGIQDIGTLGGNFSFANDNNELGQVVGYSETVGGHEFAFVWNEIAGLNEIISTTGTSSRAWGINDDGVVVGVERNDLAQRPPTAFIWTEVSGVTLLDFPDGTSSTASGINEGQEIVGQFTTIAGEQSAFLWTEASGVVDLQSLIEPGLGWDFTAALAINDIGDIVGYGQLSGETRGFLLTPIPEPQGLTMCVISMFFALTVFRKT